ncbi:MAG: polysaccharide deacetylase family protein [Bacteroidales bacterium]|nr:polysaccharide deacetylase family protein [Bacteroidales bacterium]
MSISLFTRFPNPFLKGIRRVKGVGKVVYITFDDGPTPDVTEQILEVLDKYSVKATYFCCGQNADANPELLKKIADEGHTIGYHSYSHKDILKTKPSEWLADVERKSALSDVKLFRPPYGRILFRHYRSLKSRYKFVFWDVMSYDYDVERSPETIMSLLEKSVREGSVVVFHDKGKCKENTLAVLPQFIELMKSKGYSFGVL